MRIEAHLAIAIVISPPIVSALSHCYPSFSSEANYEKGSLVSFDRFNYECVANLSCQCIGNHPSNEFGKNCWKSLGLCSDDFVNFSGKCPSPFNSNFHYTGGDSVLVGGISVYECRSKPNGSYCNKYENETWRATENSDWIYLGRCEKDSIFSSHLFLGQEGDDPPTEEIDAHRFTGSFHLAIFEEESSPVRSMLDDDMDGLVLKFLRDNRVRNHCEAILVQTIEQAVYEQRVKSVENTFVVSNVLEMEVTFVLEDVSEDDDDDDDDDVVGNGGGNPCSPEDLCLCCASGSISSSRRKYCRSLGCDLNNCSRKSSRGENQGRRLRSIEKKNREEDLSGQDFLNVVKKYTSFEPIGLAVIMNATDTDEVAACGANRFVDDNFLENSFTCDVYDDKDCANNEDIIFYDDNDICYSVSDLFV